MSEELLIMRYFTYAHLPERLQVVSRPFCELAESIYSRYLENGGDYAEMYAGLRKLLEAKGAIVRSVV